MTTSLSPDGVFWVQLSLDDPGFDAMADELRLKLSESRDIMTPVFFNAGDLCAGVFSEDESWYRARVISAREGMVCNVHCTPYHYDDCVAYLQYRCMHCVACIISH